jgi:2-amino-4-hydroxy-6-hydroxymethyldihydropteridine diphosphokinase/dihydropteroate synthase
MDELTVILGLGTNISNRLENLRKAIALIQKSQNIEIIKLSNIYISKALLKEGSPSSWNQDFFNMSIQIKTSLHVCQLLDLIQQLEIKLGRPINHAEWSPRVIDIDILSAQHKTITLPNLIIPHKELLSRSFALIPLLEVDPNWKHPKHPTKNLHALVKTLAPIEIAPYRIKGTKLIGIINLTPESMSGPQTKDELFLDKISKKFINLVNNGAEIIDIGAESTRPNAIALTPKEEWLRLKPILNCLDRIKQQPQLLIIPKISIDTYHPETMLQLQKYNIDIINDIYSIKVNTIASVLKDYQGKYIFMHNCGKPGINYINENQSITDEIISYFNKKSTQLIKSGLRKSQLIYDLGFGFGKNHHQIKEIISNLNYIRSKIHVPLLIGHSRKLSALPSTQSRLPQERDLETASLSQYFAKHHIDYLRVHNSEYSNRLIQMNHYLSS